jgi:hypothetical protein
LQWHHWQLDEPGSTQKLGSKWAFVAAGRVKVARKNECFFEKSESAGGFSTGKSGFAAFFIFLVLPC